MKLLMLHGVNHNMFGYRDPALYGHATYEQINESLMKVAEELGVELEIFQTNYEGAFVEKIHEAFFNKTDAIVINPGGWTNYCIGVADALRILTVPIVEIHMSNIFTKHGGTARGETSAVATGVVIGLGIHSYEMGLRAAVALAKDRQAEQA